MKFARRNAFVAIMVLGSMFLGVGAARAQKTKTDIDTLYDPAKKQYDWCYQYTSGGEDSWLKVKSRYLINWQKSLVGSLKGKKASKADVAYVDGLLTKFDDAATVLALAINDLDDYMAAAKTAKDLADPLIGDLDYDGAYDYVVDFNGNAAGTGGAATLCAAAIVNTTKCWAYLRAVQTVIDNYGVRKKKADDFKGMVTSPWGSRDSYFSVSPNLAGFDPDTEYLSSIIDDYSSQFSSYISTAGSRYSTDYSSVYWYTYIPWSPEEKAQWYSDMGNAYDAIYTGSTSMTGLASSLSGEASTIGGVADSIQGYLEGDMDSSTLDSRLASILSGLDAPSCDPGDVADYLDDIDDVDTSGIDASVAALPSLFSSFDSYFASFIAGIDDFFDAYDAIDGYLDDAEYLVYIHGT